MLSWVEQYFMFQRLCYNSTTFDFFLVFTCRISHEFYFNKNSYKKMSCIITLERKLLLLCIYTFFAPIIVVDYQ